jgi:hypothetical protein
MPSGRLTLPNMLSKPLVFTALAACSLPSASTANQPERPLEPPVVEQGENQHFCCSEVHLDTKRKIGTGDDCVAIAKENINACNAVLYCPSLYTKSDGVVTCTQ